MSDYDGQVNGETSNGPQVTEQQYNDTVSQQQHYDTMGQDQALGLEIHVQDEQEQINCCDSHEEGDDTMDTQSPPVQSKTIIYDPLKIFIGGLHPATKQTDLEEHFSVYGNITKIQQSFDETSQSRGYAFVIYEDSSSVQKALKDCPHTINKKVVDVKQAIPHEIHQQMKIKTKKVFVGGVPPEMPEETIHGYFKKFGPIDEVALVTEKGSVKRRGFVFVTFVSEESADKACQFDENHEIDGSKVEVKRATPRDQNKVLHNFGHGGIPPHFMPRGRGHFPSAGGRGQFTPYGGHATYYPMVAPPPMYGGGYMGGGGGYNAPYGGYGGAYGFDQYGGGGGRRDDAYNSSRYGPMRSNYGHGHSHSHVHPYSR